MFTALERVIIRPRSGAAPLTGHFMGYNHFGDPMVVYHDHPQGQEWGLRRRDEVTGNGDPCDCPAAQLARQQA